MEKNGPYIWTYLNPLHQKMICAKFGWNWPHDSGGEDFFLICQSIFTILELSPFGTRRGPAFEKLEFPSPIDDLCQVWLELTQWFWRRWFFKLKFEKLETPHPKMIYANFGWNWPGGSGEEDENVKSLWQRLRQRQRRQTKDKFWSEKLTWAFGWGELKTREFTKCWKSLL